MYFSGRASFLFLFDIPACQDHPILRRMVLDFKATVVKAPVSGPGWNGASGVHVHMTNTRTTDVEILEKRYPVLLREFSIRKGSGGNGRWTGGNGIVRDWECRVPLTFTMISERRVHRPYGMNGGEPGGLGANYWAKKNEDGSYRWLSIGSRGQVDLAAGDRYVVHTPGGGGWGAVEESVERDDDKVNGQAKSGRMQYPRATGSVHTYAAAQEAAS